MKNFKGILKGLLLSTTLLLGTTSIFAKPVDPKDEQLTFSIYNESGNEVQTVPLVYKEEYALPEAMPFGSDLPTRYHNLVSEDYATGFSIKGSTRIDYANRYFSPNSRDKIYAECREEGYSDTLNTVSWNTYRMYPDTEVAEYIGSVDFDWVPNSDTGIEFYGSLNNCNPDSFYTFSISKEGYVGNVFGNYTVSH